MGRKARKIRVHATASSREAERNRKRARIQNRKRANSKRGRVAADWN